MGCVTTSCKTWADARTLMWLTGVVMPQVEKDRIVKYSTEARAGAGGHNVRYVLVFSTVAVIVLFIVVYLVVT